MSDGICPFAEQIAGVRPYTPGNYGRVGFCDHTAGGFYSTLRSASFWNGAGLSVHFGISRKGEICQLVNIFDTAYAQGRLGPEVTWPPYRQMGMANPNLYLISTEHEDAEIVDGRTRFIPGSQWTEAQYEADLRLKRWCIDEVRRVTGEDLMRFGIDSLAGHHMFDGVNRAECPGRYWRDEYRARLFHDLTDGGGDDVTENETIELALLRSKSRLDKAFALGRVVARPGPTPDTVEIVKVEMGTGVPFDPPAVVKVE
jgi:hypothetical protein